MSHREAMRPSTSPDVGFINSVALNRAKSISSITGHGTTTMAITAMTVGPRPPLPRGPPTFCKLNPLVASISNPAPSMMGMMIVGQPTGEEKFVSLVERRNSISTPGAEAAGANARRENIHTKDQQRIRKLESELKRSQDLLKAKAEEYGVLQNFCDSQRAALAHMEVEKERAGHALLGEAESRQEEVDALKAKIAKITSDMDTMMATHTKQRRELEASLLEKIDREKRLLEEERDKNKLAFRLKDEELHREIAKWKKEVDSLNNGIRELKQENERNLAKSKGDTRGARETEDALRTEVRQLRSEVVGQAATVDEAKRQSKAFYDYMITICQPQFTVVKDQQMTPMETIPTNSACMDGYVLVPLKLLLEGYALLPLDIKRKIAEDYADDIRTGRVPAANASTFAIGNTIGNTGTAPVSVASSLRRNASVRRSSESK